MAQWLVGGYSSPLSRHSCVCDEWFTSREVSCLWLVHADYTMSWESGAWRRYACDGTGQFAQLWAACEGWKRGLHRATIAQQSVEAMPTHQLQNWIISLMSAAHGRQRTIKNRHHEPSCNFPDNHHDGSSAANLIMMIDSNECQLWWSGRIHSSDHSRWLHDNGSPATFFRWVIRNHYMICSSIWIIIHSWNHRIVHHSLYVLHDAILIIIPMHHSMPHHHGAKQSPDRNLLGEHHQKVVPPKR